LRIIEFLQSRKESLNIWTLSCLYEVASGKRGEITFHPDLQRDYKLKRDPHVLDIYNQSTNFLMYTEGLQVSPEVLEKWMKRKNEVKRASMAKRTEEHLKAMRKRTNEKAKSRSEQGRFIRRRAAEKAHYQRNHHRISDTKKANYGWRKKNQPEQHREFLEVKNKKQRVVVDTKKDKKAVSLIYLCFL
jgi:hypothetical protein